MSPAAEPAIGAPLAARLLIHTRSAGEGPAASQGWLPRRLAGLGAWLVAWRPRGITQPALVRIDDLDGRRFFACADARPCIDLPLPAGTYHVSLQVGALRRRYTVVLEQGATVNLELPPAPDSAATHP